MTSTCPLIFHVLSAPCLSNFSSAVPSLLLFLYSSHPSLPLVPFSPHLFVKEQKCRYSSSSWCFFHYHIKGFLKPHWAHWPFVLVQFHSGYIPLWWHTWRNRPNPVQLYFCTIDARMKDAYSRVQRGSLANDDSLKIYFSQRLYILSAEATGHCKFKSYLSSYCELYYWLN